MSDPLEHLYAHSSGDVSGVRTGDGSLKWQGEFRERWIKMEHGEHRVRAELVVVGAVYVQHAVGSEGSALNIAPVLSVPLGAWLSKPKPVLSFAWRVGEVVSIEILREPWALDKPFSVYLGALVLDPRGEAIEVLERR